MTDLPPLPKVYVVAPNFQVANGYAKEHGLARRRMHVIMSEETLAGVRGDVYLCWPPNYADPNWIVERVRTDPAITVAPCRRWDGTSTSSSQDASLSSQQAG